MAFIARWSHCRCSTVYAWMNGFTTVPQYQWSSGKTKTSYEHAKSCELVSYLINKDPVDKWQLQLIQPITTESVVCRNISIPVLSFNLAPAVMLTMHNSCEKKASIMPGDKQSQPLTGLFSSTKGQNWIHSTLLVLLSLWNLYMTTSH